MLINYIISFLWAMSRLRVLFSSSITEHTVFGRKIFMKRDDLLRLNRADDKENSAISGNKARKLKFLWLKLQLGSTAIGETFPQYVVSFGGVQSNSMVAIAKCCYKRAKFYYFVKRVPPFLKKNPIGNFDVALDLGVNMIEVAPIVYDELVNIQNNYDGSLKEGSSLFLRKLCGLKDVAPEVASDLLWVPQGAAMAEAQDGVADLAAEIFEFITSSPDASSPWKVIFACGTGATAYFCALRLHQLSQEWRKPTATSDRSFSPDIDIEVIALPCATSVQELQAQIAKLAAQCQHDRTLASKVLRIMDHREGTSDKEEGREPPPLSFAEPSVDHLRIWRALCAETGLDFDLVYTPRAFEILLRHVHGGRQRDHFDEEKSGLCHLFPDAKIIYYHCGGVEGNISQMARYKFKGLLS